MNRTLTSNSAKRNISPFLVPLLLKAIVVISLFLLICNTGKAQNPGTCATMTCATQIQVSLDQSGKAYVNPGMVILGPLNCPPMGWIGWVNSQNQPLPSPTGAGEYNYADCSMIGKTNTIMFKHSWGPTCNTIVKVEDKLPPQIFCKDVTVSCLDVLNIPTPVITDNCTAIASSSFVDNFSNLPCGQNGMQAGNATTAWSVMLPKGGNGTVNTQGAPASVVINGAKNVTYNVSPRYVTSYSTTSLTFGYVCFDWLVTGGNPNIDVLYFSINDSCVQLSKAALLSGKYCSQSIKPGDMIKIEMTSDGDVNNGVAKISNFVFNSTMVGMYTRVWTATDAYGNVGTCTQKIYVQKPLFKNIYFPKNYNDVDKPVLSCGASTDPKDTGFPIIDDDGNLNTTGDQHIITGSTQGCIKATYTDQVIPTCPGSKTIVRTWIVVEACGSGVANGQQIIKVYDKKAPVITCPQNITVSTNGLNCAGSITLPQTTATDDCSGVASIVPKSSFGNGYGPFNNVPVGTTIVTYVATDGCGNTATCTMTVTVKDVVPPIPVVVPKLNVSLTLGGLGTVSATALDAGSVDNCCLDKKEIRRMDEPNAPFGQTVNLSCADIGKVIMVVFRVTDCAGNVNTAMPEVCAFDKLPPLFTTCPANVTVNCGTNTDNLSSFGSPTVVDNCAFTLLYEEKKNINGMCGIGNIIRTWIATDNGGLSATCVQTITVANSTPWNSANNKIIWPQDYKAQACASTGTGLKPDQLPFPYNQPSFKDVNCGSPVGNYTDQVFTTGVNSTAGCYKILRTWTVIDWCSYNANVSATVGKWTYVQSIDVIDNQVPDLVVGKDTLVFDQNKTCGSTFVKVPLATATDCSPNVAITNSFNNGGADASGIYPYGTTTVKYYAKDNCGNVSVKELKITVKDGKKPTPVCKNGISSTFMPWNGSGMAMLGTQVFNAGSYDNCTTANKLKFSFSANPADTILMYSCDSIGYRKIRLWVTDESGNKDFCTTYVILDDNSKVCKTTAVQMSNVSGEIMTEKKAMVTGAMIKTNAQFVAPIFTNTSGKYLLNGIPFGNNLKIWAEKDTNPRNGVSTYDLYLMHRHILGTQPITSPYTLIAADVNASGSITTGDITELRKIILNQQPTFSNNKSWRFVDMAYKFTTATPLKEAFPEFINIQSNVPTTLTKEDFIGIKIGDVSGNADPNLSVMKNEVLARNGQQLSIVTEDRDLKAGETVTIPFRTIGFENIAGLQYTVDFDKAAIQFVGFENGDIKDLNDNNFGFTNISEGAITCAYANVNGHQLTENEMLYSLTFKVLRDTKLSDVLHLNSRITSAEAYGTDGNMVNLGLQFNNNAAVAHGFNLFQNQPNPFKGMTKISFELPAASDATLLIHDATGKIMTVYDGSYESGLNQIQVDLSALPSGVYYYQLRADKNVATKKMIVY
jgi:hypothetical protein